MTPLDQIRLNLLTRIVEALEEVERMFRAYSALQ